MQLPESTQRLLTLTEASALLALSPATVRKWRLQNRLPVVKLGRAVRVRLQDIERIMQAGVAGARARDRGTERVQSAGTRR